MIYSRQKSFDSHKGRKFILLKATFRLKKYEKSKKITNFAAIMWIDPIKTIDLIIKGLIVGIIVSAPMGPVGILTVRRTLNKGHWFGLATGIGAAVSDMIYAVLTVLGMSVVMDFIEKPATMFYLRLGGSIMLFIFGWYTYRSVPTIAPPGQNRGSLFQNALTGFLVTLSNPLIVFLFMALFARFDFIQPEHHVEQSFGVISILLGALIWWISLTYAIKKVRNSFHMDTIGRINRFIGIAVMIASVVGLLFTIYY